MLKPTRDTALQRPDLGESAFEINQEAPTMGYIGSIVFPYHRVRVNSMEYPVMPKELLLQLLDTSRGPSGHYNRWEGQFESGFFKTYERGLEAVRDDRFLAMYESLFDYELMLTRVNQEGIMRKMEYDIAAKVFNTAQFTPHNAAVNWATVDSATPKKDIDEGKKALRLNGVTPNCLIVTYSQFLDLQRNAEIQARVYQIFPDAMKTGDVTIAHLRSYFDVEQVLVAGAIYNSAQRNQDAEIAEIWGDRYAMLCRIARQGSDITEPCIGRTFLWNEGAGAELIVEEYRDESVRSDVIRNRHDVDYAYIRSYDEDKTVKSDISAACGYLIDTTAAT
jgi:hypothetical protein